MARQRLTVLTTFYWFGSQATSTRVKLAVQSLCCSAVQCQPFINAPMCSGSAVEVSRSQTCMSVMHVARQGLCRMTMVFIRWVASVGSGETVTD